MRHLSVFTTEYPSGVSTRLRAGVALAALLLTLAGISASCTSDDDSDSDGNEAGGAAGSSQAGSSGSGDNDGAGGAEPEPDAGDGSGEEGITLSWTPRDLGDVKLYDWIEQPGLAGVEVCLIESVGIPCVYTDDTGLFELHGVPTNSEVLLTFSKEGYVPYLVSVRTGTDDLIWSFYAQPLMEPQYRCDERFDAAGVVLDESKGHITVGTMAVVGGPIYGPLTVSIDPPVGDGPFFLDNDLHAVPGATGLSEEVVAASFVNLEEGEYVISWENEAPEKMSCHLFRSIEQDLLAWGLPAEQPNALRVNVRAGLLSGGNAIECAPVADPAADAGD
jgi:hypothetical protein